MSGQKLHKVIVAYRIGDPDGDYPIFDATGSKLFPGRWNTPSSPMIYAAEHYSTAMLEKLVNGSGSIPPNQHFIEITLPIRLSYEVVTSSVLPHWEDADCKVAKQFGEPWQQQKRSVLLFVPSVVARQENNILINPDHPEFHHISHGIHQPIFWDNRLFDRPPSAKHTPRPKKPPAKKPLRARRDGHRITR